MSRVCVLALLATITACASLAPPRYRGPITDHFDGERFHNYGPDTDEQVSAGIIQELHRPEGRANWAFWENTPPSVPPSRVGNGRVLVTLVNHATVLVQMDSLNILTDPIWSRHASPLASFGPLRHRPPGIEWDSLPPIDLVLVSHNHYDHMDLHTLRRVSRRFHPVILVGLGNAAFLERNGIKGARDMDWWQTVEVKPGIRISGVPAQHYSQRSFTDRWRTLWLGFVIAGPSGRIYFAGDTGLGGFLVSIRERFAPLRLAILPIGPGLPVRAMGPQHMSAGDAIEAYKMLGVTAAFGMHFGTFQQGDETQSGPTEWLKRVIDAQACEINFWSGTNGESWDVPQRTSEPRCS